MVIYQGKGVCPGIVIGCIHVMHKKEAIIHDTPISNPKHEWERYLVAKEETDSQLKALFEKVRQEVGEDEAMIIDVQRMMLKDGDFNETIQRTIHEDKRCAPYAISQAEKEFSTFFASLDDPYMNARSTDVSDVSQRLIDVLLGRSSNLQLAEPAIIVADDLTPSETLQIDKSKIKAFVIRGGSSNSHTAILARTMNIPCVVQTNIPVDSSINGKDAIVDGSRGICCLEPDESSRNEMIAKQKAEFEKKVLLDSMRGLPTVTKSGRYVHLYSNIGNVEDLDAVLQNDSEGIGLFRSEFLYLGRSNYPTEDELFSAYRQVAKGMNGKPVVVRTLDIGADKQADYFELDEEQNPALGLRGIRVCLERPRLFRTQLRAICRASAFGSIAIMFPMITSLWEVRKCKEITAKVRNELIEQGFAVGELKLGIMIETPSSVIISDSLAKEVDFFSVGTNDLTQYTLAIDRQNSKLDRFHDDHHPAVIEMLRMTAQSAVNNGIWAGICGELAADTNLTALFIDMGFTKLSVSPALTLGMRKLIRDMK